MNNITSPQQNSSPASFWDDMIQMEKELPLACKELLYAKVKKMRGLALSDQFDAGNYNF